MTPLRKGMATTLALSGLALTVALVGNPFSGPFGGGNGGGGGGSVASSATFTSTQTDGGAAFVAPTGQRVCLNGSGCTVYAQYDGGSIGLVGSEVDVPNGFTDSQKVNADTIITPYSVVPQAVSGQAAFRVAQTGARVYFDTGGNIYCYSTGAKVVCGSTWDIPSFETDTIGAMTGGRDRVEIFYPQPYPLNSLLSCDSAHKGVIQTLSTDGETYACNGTTNGRVAKMATWSGSLNFAAVTARTCSSLTFAATGAVLDEPVAPGGCGSVFNGDANMSCFVAITATDTATVRLCCHDNSNCADLPAITFTATAIR